MFYIIKQTEDKERQSKQEQLKQNHNIVGMYSDKILLILNKF